MIRPKGDRPGTPGCLEQKVGKWEVRLVEIPSASCSADFRCRWWSNGREAAREWRSALARYAVPSIRLCNFVCTHHPSIIHPRAAYEYIISLNTFLSHSTFHDARRQGALQPATGRRSNAERDVAIGRRTRDDQLIRDRKAEPASGQSALG